MIFKTMEELQDEDNLCNYCFSTDYGATKCVQTPTGADMCEGRFCNEAYEAYLEEAEYEEED